MEDLYWLYQVHICVQICANLCKRFFKNLCWCHIKFTFAGDDNGKREEDLEEEIKDVKERFRDAEVKNLY